MTYPYKHIVDLFDTLDVLVIGEAMLDVYMEGSATRICREAPVPIVDVSKATYAPGGAANTAINATALRARTQFLSIIGDDEDGAILNEALKKHGVDISSVFVSPKRRTLAKKRVSASGQLLVRYDTGTQEAINEDDEKKIIEVLLEKFPRADGIIISDYGYGILTDTITRVLAKLQEKYHKPLLVDAKHLKRYEDFPSSAVKPNYKEASELLALPSQFHDARIEQILDAREQLFEKIRSKIIAVTLDKEGALVFTHGGSAYRTFTKPTENTKAAGAGDSYAATFLLSLAADATAQEAAELAALTTRTVITKEGTSTCSLEELRDNLLTNEKTLSSQTRLDQVIKECRESGKRIVFTNGCFDILHSGHVQYLNRAKQLGDILIVGLNNDESVRLLKGPTRPVNTLADRANVLSSLSSIDYIVPFSEATPENLVQRIKPEIYTKGGDYTPSVLPETRIVENYGGRVIILPYLKGHSTTSIIQKMQHVSL